MISPVLQKQCRSVFSQRVSQWNRLTWKEVFGSSRPSRLAGRMESSYRFLPWKHQRFGEILRVLLMLGIYSRICLWILARFIQHIVGFQHKFGFKQEEQWSWLTNNRYLDYKQIPKIEDYQQKWNNVWLSSTKTINPSPSHHGTMAAMFSIPSNR
jgi:hypothetical protein